MTVGGATHRPESDGRAASRDPISDPGHEAVATDDNACPSESACPDEMNLACPGDVDLACPGDTASGACGGPAFPLADGVSSSLVHVARSHRSLAATLLAEIGIYPGQELLLFLLAERNATPSQLATVMRVEPPTVTKMVKRMEAAGLIERADVGPDKRVRPIRLSPHGHAVAAAAREAWDRLELATIASLSDDESAELQRLLLKVADGLATNAAHATDAADGSTCGAVEPSP